MGELQISRRGVDLQIPRRGARPAEPQRTRSVVACKTVLTSWNELRRYVKKSLWEMLEKSEKMLDREADYRQREAELTERIQKLEARRRDVESSEIPTNFGDAQISSSRTVRADDTRRAMDCDLCEVQFTGSEEKM